MDGRMGFIQRTVHSGRNGVEQTLLLKVTEEKIGIIVDECIAFGSMQLSRLPSSTWALMTLNERWLALVPGDDIRASSATIWHYFGSTNMGKDPLWITWAKIPEYLQHFILKPAPPAKAIHLRLLYTHGIDNLLLAPELADCIARSLQAKSNIHACLLEGDSFWISIELFGQTRRVALQIESQPFEVLADLSNVQIFVNTDPLHAPLPPSKSFAIELEASMFNDIRTIFTSPTGKAKIVAIIGEHSAVERTLVEVTQELGIPVRTFPLEGKLTHSPFHTCWVLKVVDTSSQPLIDLVKGIVKEGPSNNVLVILCENNPSDVLISLLSMPTIQTVSHGEIIESAQALRMLEPSLSGPEAIKRLKKRACNRSFGSEIPRVNWEDIAGLEDIKQMLVKTFTFKQQTCGGRRCGILFYGPPGTGKTLLAKAVATEFNYSFIPVKGPELLDIYVGESEAHIRELFVEAKRASPSIIFFDELDSIGIARGKDSDSGGVADRLVSQLLLEMDSLIFDAEGQNVFVVGATNRPDLLDEALTRPGRFDKHLYLGCPQTTKEQVEILRVSSRPYLLSLDVDLWNLAEQLDKTLSPADLAAISHEAMRLAMSRVIQRSIESNCIIAPDYAVTVSMEDFQIAASAKRKAKTSNLEHC